MKQVTIPTDYNPFVVVVNGVVYSYKAGSKQNVPDDVAKVIDNYNNLKPKEGNPDGGMLPYVTEADDGKVLGVKDGSFKVTDDKKGMTNPMTAMGDLVIGSINGAPVKLPKGTQGQFLVMGASIPEWTTVPSANGEDF